MSFNQPTYNILTIAQLEPAPNPANDLFNWPRDIHPDRVSVDGDTEHRKSFRNRTAILQR